MENNGTLPSKLVHVQFYLRNSIPRHVFSENSLQMYTLPRKFKNVHYIYTRPKLPVKRAISKNWYAYALLKSGGRGM